MLYLHVQLIMVVWKGQIIFGKTRSFILTRNRIGPELGKNLKLLIYRNIEWYIVNSMKKTVVNSMKKTGYLSRYFDDVNDVDDDNGKLCITTQKP